MRLRWAVFLPLDDHPDPSSSAIVESDGLSPAWDIILHGYFWPKQDRRDIPGVTDLEGDPSSAMATCVVVGIADYAKNCYSPYCHSHSPRRLTEWKKKQPYRC